MANNADYGMTLQKLICDEYGIDINPWAMKQFDANYNDEYEEELKQLIPYIFDKVKYKPVKLLTFTETMIEGKKERSPHNFRLSNGETLSIRTNKTGSKIAPRTVGQAGYDVLNTYFGKPLGVKINTKADIKEMVFNNIHKMLPTFITMMFKSDYTVIISREDLSEIDLICKNELPLYSFDREQFSFTRGLSEWIESTTLKFEELSIAEIQVHKERTFKFRFAADKFPKWLETIKITNETLGISAESTICELFDLKKPESFNKRASRKFVNDLMPVVKLAFKEIPKAIEHTGAYSGKRKKQSKCSYDFILEGNKTMSLKTNSGTMVCPPEVGQPSAETCWLYFSDLFEPGTKGVTKENFKDMVFKNVERLIPRYVEHLFDSDWLLWIYETKTGYTYRAIDCTKIKEMVWDRTLFTFSKNTVDEWNESNTVKYKGKRIGEFQVHNHRNCFKFRFDMVTLLSFIME